MFHPIDFAAWDRAEYYQHYMNNARCTYSITANVNITVLYHGSQSPVAPADALSDLAVRPRSELHCQPAL